MTQLNLNLPVIGQTNATEDPKVRTALSDIQTVVNALDNTNIASAADINGSKLLDSSIATAKLANGAVTTAKLALGPTYETSLPSSPVDGQEIYYAADATNGVIWHLRYRSGSSSSYKWEYVGGGPLYKEDNDVRSVTNVTAFSSSGNPPYSSDVPTDGIVLSLPVAGDYKVELAGQFEVPATAGRNVTYGYAITNGSDVIQTAASDAVSLSLTNPTGDGQAGLVTSGMVLYTISTAGFRLREQLKVSGNFTASVFRRRLYVTPIRVG